MPLGLGSLEDLGSLLGEGVDLGHGGGVSQRVLLRLVVDADVVFLLIEDSLDTIGVNDGGEIGTGHDSSVEHVASLLGGLLDTVAEDLIEGGEGGRGEDEEATEMSTRGELEDVEAVHVADINTVNVAGGLAE